VHVKIIEEVTSVLSDQDAAVADGKLAEVAQSRTYGELRRAATRLVLKLDAEAVRKRKEKARGQARVRSFREESGNAGISGREMPSVEVLLRTTRRSTPTSSSEVARYEPAGAAIDKQAINMISH